jgi:hypothetical protein
MLIYSNIASKRTYVEWWGGSTKHPDVRNCYQDDVADGKFTENKFFIEDGYNVFQWLVMRCSELTFGTGTSINQLMEMCKEYLEPMKKWG